MRFFKTISSSLKLILILTLSIYQKTLSFDHGPVAKVFPFWGCRFHPSCSQYTILAIDKHGILRGLYLGAKRLSRCHPWNPGGYDPIP